MYMVIARLLLFIVALPAAYPSIAEIYKWVDEQGRVSYGDRSNGASSVLQIEVEDSHTSTPTSDSLSREEKRRRLLDAMQEDRYEKENRRAEEKARFERNHRICVQNRDRMRQIEHAGVLYTLDSDGNRVYMSSEEREGSMRALQASIRKYCH
jgi:hypothetical protein